MHVKYKAPNMQAVLEKASQLRRRAEMDPSSENSGRARSMSEGQDTQAPNSNRVADVDANFQNPFSVIPGGRRDVQRTNSHPIPIRSWAVSEKGGITKYTEQVRETILNHIRAGNYVGVACRAAGISTTTLKNWLIEYPDFKVSVDEARAESEARDIEFINGVDSWQARAWKLERRHPERWGRLERKVVSGPDGGPIKHTVGVLMISAEQYKEAKALTERNAVAVPGHAIEEVEADPDHELDPIDGELE